MTCIGVNPLSKKFASRMIGYFKTEKFLAALLDRNPKTTMAKKWCDGRRNMTGRTRKRTIGRVHPCSNDSGRMEFEVDQTKNGWNPKKSDFVATAKTIDVTLSSTIIFVHPC